jgi:glycosyltransferase involved in cell wall biosynthesis
MKLLIVSDAWYPQVNGVVRTYEYIGAEMEKKGHEVRVIGPADFPLRIPMPGYSEIKLTLAPYRRLKKMIEDFGPDNIHIAVEGPLGWATRRYCIKYGRSFTSAYHTQFPDYLAKRVAGRIRPLYRFAHNAAKAMMRHFHAPASILMVATPSLEEALRAWGFTAPMQRLTRGATLDLFYPGEKTVFANLKRPVALYVGRVAIEKSIEDFLAMDWPGSKVVVGDGPSLESLKKKYPQAIFTGKKTGADLAAHYRSADVFVFPSRTDTFGIVLIEALACGLPVAAYNAIGPRDIITEPFLGTLHEHDLALAARHALNTGTPQERAAFVRALYTWENAASQFEAALIAENSAQKQTRSA